MYKRLPQCQLPMERKPFSHKSGACIKLKNSRLIKYLHQNARTSKNKTLTAYSKKEKFIETSNLLCATSISPSSPINLFALFAPLGLQNLLLNQSLKVLVSNFCQPPFCKKRNVGFILATRLAKTGFAVYYCCLFKWLCKIYSFFLSIARKVVHN